MSLIRFACLDFLDDFGIQTARTGNSSSQNQQFPPDIQRVFCSGYLINCDLKVQIVSLPIGVKGSVFITETRQNGNGVQHVSGLNNYLLQLLFGIFIGGIFLLFILMEDLLFWLQYYQDFEIQQHLCSL